MDDVETNAQLGNPGEPHQASGNAHLPLTTQQGVPAGDNQNSFRAGLKAATEAFITEP